MLASVETTPSSLRVDLTPEDGDREVSGRARPGRRSFGVWAPEGLRLDDVHPDLVALSVLLVAQPWAAHRLVLQGTDGVSDRLARAVHTAYRIELSGGAVVAPREAPDHGRPGLAFSGGVDSTAAMVLMPHDTPLVFLNRVGPDRGPNDTGYQSAAALDALARLRHDGREAHTVDTDLEHTRQPTGFPTHWANAIPSILFADQLVLHSISWGMVLEAAYGVGSATGYQDWSGRASMRKLVGLFAAVWLPVSPVVAGLSEVATSTVVLGSPYASIARSCVRGSVEPCGRCKKCFRKGLLDRALTSPTWTEDDLEPFYRVASVRQVLTEVPLHHEDVYGFLLSGYRGEDEVLSLLRRQVRAGDVDYSLFGRYHPGALDLVHGSHRQHVARALREHLEPMTGDEVARLTAWRPVGASDPDDEVHQALLDVLARYEDPGVPPSLRERLALRTRLRRLLRRSG